ncbi:uncharacterized protein LOC127462567 [Manacus candei]|uniref:uncharacterized protein LOC127462567 n=1 Tax=Manacus candei TaxID=415023 RepID=UPI002226579D|nr:uncharacterized protein LOC127462567 [Manacus candei]
MLFMRTKPCGNTQGWILRPAWALACKGRGLSACLPPALFPVVFPSSFCHTRFCHTLGQCHSGSTVPSLLLLLAVAAPGGKSSVGSNAAEAGNKNAGPAPKTISNFPVRAAFQTFFVFPGQSKRVDEIHAVTGQGALFICLPQSLNTWFAQLPSWLGPFYCSLSCWHCQPCPHSASHSQGSQEGTCRVSSVVPWQKEVGILLALGRTGSCTTVPRTSGQCCSCHPADPGASCVTKCPQNLALCTPLTALLPKEGVHLRPELKFSLHLMLMTDHGKAGLSVWLLPCDSPEGSYLPFPQS